MIAIRGAGALLLAASLLGAGCASLPGVYEPQAKAALSMDRAESEQGIAGVMGAPTGKLPFTLGSGGWEDSIGAEGAAFSGPGEENAGPASRRLLIYSGHLTVAVASVSEAVRSAREAAEELGGYFQSLKGDTITLRVPADRWEEALAAVSALGRVLRRDIEAADVTEEVVDLELRLRNARALGKRLEELLAQAKNVEDTLAVERELDRIRTEIERIEGKLKVLRDRIAFSTLVASFVAAAEAPARPQSLPFAWLHELSIEGLLGLPGGVR